MSTTGSKAKTTTTCTPVRGGPSATTHSKSNGSSGNTNGAANDKTSQSQTPYPFPVVIPIQLGVVEDYLGVKQDLASKALREQMREDGRQIIKFTEPLDPSAMIDSVYTCKIGGLPCWFVQEGPETDMDIPVCPNCGQRMLLVVQLYAPCDVRKTDSDAAPEAPRAISSYASPEFVVTGEYIRYPRIVYVFACNASGGTRPCAYNPKSWCVKVACHTQGTVLERTGQATDLRELTAESRKRVKKALKEWKINDAYVSSDEEGDDLSSDDDEEDSAEAQEARRAEMKAKEAEILGKIDQIISTQAAKKASKNTSGGMFELGAWSDDSDEDEHEEQKKPAAKPAVAPAKTHAPETTTNESKQAVESQSAPVQLETKYLKASSDQPLYAYKPMFLSWLNEPTFAEVKEGEDDDYEHEKKLLEAYEKEKGQSLKAKVAASEKRASEEGVQVTTDANDGWGEDEYQASADKAFRRFFHRTNLVPDQCVRYSDGGKPLTLHDGMYTRAVAGLPSDSTVGFLRPLSEQSVAAAITTTSAMPKCSSCGGRMKLEFQLMPQLFTELLGPTGMSIAPPDASLVQATSSSTTNTPTSTTAAADAEGGDDDADAPEFVPLKPILNTGEVGIEFGAVDVYTCENACSRGKFATGFCIVQEPV